MRSVIAVLAGYAVFAGGAAVLFLTTGQSAKVLPSRTFLVVTFLWGVTFSLSAGAVVAWLAPSHPVRHADILAVTLALIAAVSIVLERSKGSIWSQLTVILLLAPAIAAGARLFARWST